MEIKTRKPEWKLNQEKKAETKLKQQICRLNDFFPFLSFLSII